MVVVESRCTEPTGGDPAGGAGGPASDIQNVAVPNLRVVQPAAHAPGGQLNANIATPAKVGGDDVPTVVRVGDKFPMPSKIAQGSCELLSNHKWKRQARMVVRGHGTCV